MKAIKVLSLLTFLSSVALAQESAATEAPQAPLSLGGHLPGVEGSPVQLTVPWTGPTGKGVGLGIEEGGWTGAYGSGLRVHVPFGQYFGVTLRGAFISGGNQQSGGATADNPNMHVGGRFELIGHSPVFLNLVRLYGGGGVEVFSAVGANINHDAKWGGGGHFGFEFFTNKWSSFYLEVGGHSGVDKGLPGGQTIVVGMNFYPWST